MIFLSWSQNLRQADRLAKVFATAREKQPSLIFIDELDAVCPPRGAYADAISQEFTAQLLQEVDRLLSDSQAIFLVGATNRLDQVDGAILSRFSEQIEIPWPDLTARTALLRCSYVRCDSAETAHAQFSIWLWQPTVAADAIFEPLSTRLSWEPLNAQALL